LIEIALTTPDRGNLADELGSFALSVAAQSLGFTW
jgi:hypothetical protein